MALGVRRVGNGVLLTTLAIVGTDCKSGGVERAPSTDAAAGVTTAEKKVEAATPRPMSAEAISAALSAHGAKDPQPVRRQLRAGMQWEYRPWPLPIVTFFDFAGLNDRTCIVGPEETVCVEAPKPESDELAHELAKRRYPTIAEVLAGVRALGFTIETDLSSSKDLQFVFGFRERLVRGTKGNDMRTFWFLDYSEAARGTKRGAVRITDAQLLILTGEFAGSSPITAEALANEIAGK
jgi:hypothetical protein